MEISLAMEDSVTLPLMENSHTLNVHHFGINAVEFSKVKKKLEYGTVSAQSKAHRKGMAIVTDRLNGFHFISGTGEMKPPEISPPTLTTKDSISTHNAANPPVKFYSLSGRSEGVNRLDVSQLNIMDSKKIDD